MTLAVSLKGISGAMRRGRHAILGLTCSIVLLALVYSLEDTITQLFGLLVQMELAKALYFSLLGLAILFTSYHMYKIYISVTMYVIEGLSARPSIRPAMPMLSLFSRILGLVLVLIATVGLFSGKVPFLYELMQGIMASFSGLFSILIALILALQVKEIVGNYLAGAILKASRVVSEEEFLNMGDEYLKIEEVDLSYTKLVNRFGERIYIPNLKFLVDTFRKPFSKENRRYVELKFSLPYGYAPDKVYRDISEIIEKHNNDPGELPPIDDYRILTLDLASYSVLYELQVRPPRAVFPEALRSSVRKRLHEKFGADLATPMMLNITK